MWLIIGLLIGFGSLLIVSKAQTPNSIQRSLVSTSTQSKYDELLQDPKWEARRKHILYRDHYKCRHCGSKSNLQVHHKEYHIYKGEFVKPWRYDDGYLITLCSQCHKKAHEKKIPIKYYNFTTKKFE